MINRLIYIVFVAALAISCEEDPKISKSQEDFNLKVFGGASSDICNAIAYDGDNLYLTGSIDYTNGPDMFLIKTDNFGNEVSWSPKLFGSSGSDAGHDIAIDRNQNVLVAGYQVMPLRGDSNVLVSKINSNGEELWTKTFGGTRGEVAYAINVSSSNKILVAGYTESINFAVKQRQGWLMELSENGDSLWSNDYGTSNVPDELKDILELEDSYLLVGNTLTSFGTNKRDAFVFIINKETKGIQNSQFLYKSGNDFGVSAVQLLTRDFVIVGYTQVNNIVNNIILWKLNEDLQTIAMKQIESSVSEIPSSITFVDGSLVIVGTVAKEQNNDDYLIYTLDTNLSVTSRNQYGSKGNQRGMAGAVIGKSVVIGGCTTSGNSSKASIFKTPAILP